MTSKEFLRKVFFYRAYAGAFDLFSSSVKPTVIWKIEMYGSEGERATRFSFDLPNLVLMFYNTPVKTVSVDEFSYTDFVTQMSYFKSFLSKCSPYQIEVLRSDSELSLLLKFVWNDFKI